MCRNNKLLDISLTISPIRDASGKVVGASKIARDATQRKKIERELRESEERYRTLADALDTQVQFRTQEIGRRNSELRALSSHLVEFSGCRAAAHRPGIARQRGSNFGRVGYESVSANKKGRRQFCLTQSIGEIEELVQHLTNEIRTTSYLLHPPMLDETGISSALSWYVQGLEERGGLKIDLTIPEGFGRLPSEMELLIFRLVQECLTNSHRHSGSKTAQIELEREGENIHLRFKTRERGCLQND